MDNSDYNIEDTAKLMADTRHGSRRKRTLLIIIAVIGVLLISCFAGYKVIGEKKYTGQIAIAEKAFAEGEYEQAETAYLNAMGLKGRRPEAREGLAYLYAFTGRFEESEIIYRELYEETNDPEHGHAADDTSRGILPSTDGAVPVRFWRGITADSVPFRAELLRFLYGANDDFASEGRSFAYDAQNPEAGANLLHSLMEAKHPLLYNIPAGARDVADGGMLKDVYTEYIDLDYGETDPKGWRDEKPDMAVIDSDTVDRALRELFYVSDSALKGWRSKGEKDRLFYLDGDKYYSFCRTDADDRCAVDIVSVKTDGVRFCIEYKVGNISEYDEFDDEFFNNYGFSDWSVDTSDPEAYETCYAVMELRAVDGERYWSMRYNGTDLPEELLDIDKELKQAPVYSVKTEMDDEMKSELINFLSYLPYYSYGGSMTWGESAEVNYAEYYNYEQAADAAIMYNIMWNVPCIDYDIYPVDFERAEPWIQGEKDPLGRAANDYGQMMFYRTNAAAVDWAAKNIFNASDEDIAREVMESESRSASGDIVRSFYLHDGYYYLITGGIGWMTSYEFEIDNVRTEGDYFIIDYTQIEYMASESPTDYLHFEVKMQYKLIDGKGYWSLYERRLTD